MKNIINNIISTKKKNLMKVFQEEALEAYDNAK
jgi:hypothetical protein